MSSMPSDPRGSYARAGCAVTLETSETPTETSGGEPVEVKLVTKPVGPGARLTDQELVDQVKLRQLLGRDVDIPPLPVEFAEDEEFPPDSYAGMLNPPSAMIQEWRQIILPLIVSHGEGTRKESKPENCHGAHLYLGVPKNNIEIVERKNRIYTNLTYFGSFADRRLINSETFIRAFGGIIGQPYIDWYYRIWATLNLFTEGRKFNPLTIQHKAAWPRGWRNRKYFSPENILDKFPVTRFLRGYDLGKVSLEGGQSWNVCAIVQNVPGAATSICKEAQGNKRDHMQWIELTDMQDLMSKNPPIELVAALLKLSVAL